MRDHLVHIFRARIPGAKHVREQRLLRVFRMFVVRLFGMRRPAQAVQGNEALEAILGNRVLADVEQAPESIQREILHIIIRDRGGAREILAEIEAFDFRGVRGSLGFLRVLHGVALLDRGPSGHRGKAYSAKTKDGARQAQTEMHGFEQGIVASAENLRMAFHDGSAP